MYQKLPSDIQHIIRCYFTVWQRHGFREEPLILRPDPDAYYRTIRKCPSGMKWNPSCRFHLIYRRAAHLFKWDIWVHPTDDVRDTWSVEIRPQWELEDTQRLLYHVMEHAPWVRHLPNECILVDVDHFQYENLITITMMVIRKDAESRQYMAERMAQYVARMDHDICNKKKIFDNKRSV